MLRLFRNCHRRYGYREQDGGEQAEMARKPVWKKRHGGSVVWRLEKWGQIAVILVQTPRVQAHAHSGT